MNKLSVLVVTTTFLAATSYTTASRADDEAESGQPTQTTTTTVTTPPAQPVSPPTTTTSALYAAPPPANQAAFAEQTTTHYPNRTLLSTGVGIFVISYGASVIAGAVSSRDADKNLFIPVAGPWIDLGQRGCEGGSCGNNEDLNKAMIITSGIVQGVGVLLGLGSLVIPETTTTTQRSHVENAEVKVLPVAFSAGAGVGAIGRF